MNFLNKEGRDPRLVPTMGTRWIGEPDPPTRGGQKKWRTNTKKILNQVQDDRES